MSLNQSSREEILSFLAEELIKSKPEEDIVKKYMAKVGLNYSEDPVERINLVLEALHFEEPTKA